MLAVVAIPAGRRLLRARLAPILGQVVPRLLEVVQQPRKLAEGIGGTLLLTAAYILCLDASGPWAAPSRWRAPPWST